MSQSIQIENYREHLAPLLASFHAERRPSYHSKPNPDECFTDQFGNVLELGYAACLLFCGPALLKLLRNPALGRFEPKDLDRGYLSYSVYRHAESYYIVYETRVDINSWGHFSSFVVVLTLEPLIAFVENIVKRETAR